MHQAANVAAASKNFNHKKFTTGRILTQHPRVLPLTCQSDCRLDGQVIPAAAKPNDMPTRKSEIAARGFSSFLV